MDAGTDARRAVEARIDAVLAQVRASGGRATSARRAILRTLFDQHGGHPTVDDITSAVQASQPDVAESTVYRFLDELQRLGVVEHVRLGHGPGAYHLAEDTHHHHLICERCGTVVEVPGSLLGPLRKRIRAAYGFSIEPMHLSLPGLCAECADA